MNILHRPPKRGCVNRPESASVERSAKRPCYISISAYKRMKRLVNENEDRFRETNTRALLPLADVLAFFRATGENNTLL